MRRRIHTWQHIGTDVVRMLVGVSLHMRRRKHTWQHIGRGLAWWHGSHTHIHCLVWNGYTRMCMYSPPHIDVSSSSYACILLLLCMYPPPHILILICKVRKIGTRISEDGEGEEGRDVSIPSLYVCVCVCVNLTTLPVVWMCMCVCVCV